MKGALLIFAVTVLIGLILWLTDRRRKSENTQTPDSGESSDSEECCGMHAVCEKQLLSPVSPEIEYFDDEELDRFAGRTEESFTHEETDEFREILLTLPADEVASWSRSLQLRGITLPPEIRDELLLIVRENRNKNN